MIKLTLTKAQIEYLLYLKKYEKYRTITSVSLHFDCSKTNSKKILDRMVAIGVLLKEGNDYNLTRIGEEFAAYYNKKQRDIVYILEKIFSLDKKLASQMSFDLIVKDLDALYDSVENKVAVLRKVEAKKSIISTEEFIKLFNTKSIDINFNIYKIHEDNENSFIEKSMASMGFETSAQIIFDEEAYISLKSKTIEKINNGYNRKGIATKLFYHKDNEECEINSFDREFKIPLKTIEFWNNTGDGILQAGLMLRIKSQVGMKLHIKDANFIFTVNLDLI